LPPSVRVDVLTATLCEDAGMDHAVLTRALDRLRVGGAYFAYLHGSQVTGTADENSDIDLATLFHDPAPSSFALDLPPGVDLMVLNSAPLEVAGRIACHGTLVLEADETARVRWESMTRTVYLDEKYRIERSHREFLEAAARG